MFPKRALVVCVGWWGVTVPIDETGAHESQSCCLVRKHRPTHVLFHHR